MTSTSFDGFVEFRFNDLSMLDAMDLKNACLSEKQQTYLLRNMPSNVTELVLMRSHTVTILEQIEQITFEMFWNKYDDKINSSRKRTMARWDKMTPTDRCRAFWFIGKYFGSIPPGTRKKFAETYLNAELWNN